MKQSTTYIKKKTSEMDHVKADNGNSPKTLYVVLHVTLLPLLALFIAD